MNRFCRNRISIHISLALDPLNNYNISFINAVKKNDLLVEKEYIMGTKKQNISFINAVKKGNLEKVKSLLEDGANINFEDENAFTPLITASHEGHQNLVEHLIKKGANINQQTSAGVPLMAGIVGHHPEIVKYLIEKGADVNIEVECETPISVAKQELENCDGDHKTLANIHLILSILYQNGEK